MLEEEKYMVCMVWNIIYWRWEEVSRMRDERRTNSEDRATQPMEAGGWVSQYCDVRTVLDSWHLTKVSLDAGRGLKEEKHAFLLMRPNRLKSKFEGKLSTDCPHQSTPVGSFRPMPPTVEEEYKTDNILSATFVSLTALTTCFLLEFITPSLP